MTNPIDHRESFLREVLSFIEETGISRTRFGRMAVGDGSFMLRLERGGDVTLRTVERVQSYMAAVRREGVGE